MTRVQKAYSIVLTVFLLGVVVFLPDFFLPQGSIYRQFPVWYLWEEKSMSSEEIFPDRETMEEITRFNIEYILEKGKVKADSRADAEIKKEKPNKRKTEAGDTCRENEKNVSETNKTIPEKVISEPENAAEDVLETLAEIQVKPSPIIDLSPDKLADYPYLLNQFFIVDEKTSAEAVELNAATFLAMDFHIEKKKEPQILIYHTHATEAFSDSADGEEKDTIVGVGDYLSEILETSYGYQVLHIKDTFDMMEGTLDRSKAYDYARESIEKILEENPSIEIVIDLHRDGVPENRHLVRQINGKDTAQILFYNGLCYTRERGKLDYLPNSFINENLAFSFQLEYGSALYYPELYRGIYLAGYRYNLHFKPRTLLLEAGAQTNTVQEVKNAMEPFAFLLDLVLSGRLLEDTKT